jgi:flagellar M-ring protein FliF
VNGIYNVDGSDVIYAERTPEELARLGELVKTAVGFDTTRGDSVSVDSMRFMDYSMDLGDPIDKSIGDELTENVVSIVRGVLALLVVGLILVFGVRPMLRKFSEGDQLNSYEDPALTAEKTAEPAALTAEGQRPKLPGTTPAVADIAEDDDPLTVTDEDIEAAEVAEYVRKEGIRGNLHKKKIETIQQLADEKPQEVLRVIRSWLPAEAGA